MATLWGRRWTRRELEERTGDPSQLGGITRLVHDDGSARGMRAIEIDTGSGFVLWVNPDRALDVPRARFNGVPLGWRCAPGDVNPAIAEREGLELLRALPGGLLFTGGLTNVGPPSESEIGEALPLHGHLPTIPASEVGAWTEWEGDDWVMRVTGRMRQARLFGENLEMLRTISAVLGEPVITIEDTVRNAGFTPQPLMILHHMNLGAPLVSETAKIDVTASETSERGIDGPAPVESWQRYPAPEPGAPERVFFHTAAPDKSGMATATLTNETLVPMGLRGVEIRWLTAEEPRMWQWVHFASGGQVLGLEPTNAVVGTGLKDALKAGQRILQPGESAHFRIEVRVLLP